MIDRGRLLARGACGVAAAPWGDPGIDKDEIEFATTEAAAQRGDLCVVIDVEMFGANVAAGLLRELLQAALAGRVAHRADHIAFFLWLDFSVLLVAVLTGVASRKVTT